MNWVSKDRFGEWIPALTRTGVSFGAWFAMLLVSQLGASSLVHAQDGNRRVDGISSIAMDELPRPPEEIAALIKSAKVTMEFGRRASGANLSPSSRPGRSGPRKLLGETRYRISFNYRSHARWRVSGNQVRITLRYSQIRWEPTHVIWLRRMPSQDDFWTDSLVLHEFDHVRISNDRRFAQEFEKRVRDKLVLNRTKESGQRVNQAWVDREVDKHVNGIFEDISQLVAIRYKELDRVTDHGLQPIPEDSPMARFLEAGDRNLPDDDSPRS
jgi:hypothetical protein